MQSQNNGTVSPFTIAMKGAKNLAEGLSDAAEAKGLGDETDEASVLNVELAAIETPPKRQMLIPHDMPAEFRTMLLTTANQVRIVDPSKLLEEEMRNGSGNAWVRMNKNNPRYAALLVLSEALDLPAMRVHKNFCPETVCEAGMRLLRAFKKKVGDNETFLAMTRMCRTADVIDDRDVAELTVAR